MKYFARFVIMPFLLMLLLCASAVIIGRMQAEPEIIPGLNILPRLGSCETDLLCQIPDLNAGYIIAHFGFPCTLDFIGPDLTSEPFVQFIYPNMIFSFPVNLDSGENIRPNLSATTLQLVTWDECNPHAPWRGFADYANLQWPDQ